MLSFFKYTKYIDLKHQTLSHSSLSENNKQNKMKIQVLFAIVALVFSNIVLGQETCTPASAGDPNVDDGPAITKALETCGNGGTIIIPAGKTYTIRSAFDFTGCNGCTFQIEGTLKASDDLAYWEGRNAMFTFSNVNRAKFYSLTGSGTFDGSGQKFWDHFAVNSTYRRPFLIYFRNASDVTFTKLTVLDSPFWCININESSTRITFSDVNVTAISKTTSRPANTDGFDTVECSHVSIVNSYVHNGDDCVSFKNGSNFITVENITCIDSHGLSVGSLGSTPGRPHMVSNVYVSNAKMIDSAFATRIKFYPSGPRHGPVFIHNITYKDIIMENCDYGFLVDNCYESNKTECQDHPGTAIVSNVRFTNIAGTTSKAHDPVVAKIECPPEGTCDLAFDQWNVVAPSGGHTVLCGYYHNPIGITCTPGAI